jgi:hypothetical protein
MAGLNTYQHTQDSAASTWHVQHNLGVFPIVDVLVHLDGVLTKIIPMDIVLVNENYVRIEFSRPYSGAARMV